MSTQRTMHAIRVHSYGGIEALKQEEIPIPIPKDNEVLIKHHAVGVNYIDIYHRTGLYKSTLPMTLGREGAGIVESLGTGVNNFKVGDRVAYCLAEGGYAEYAAVPWSKCVAIPSQIGFKEACAAMIQGLTAHSLASSTYPLKSSDTALILAGAGGVGQLLIQIAKLRGARVITTVSTREKEAIVRSLGADEVILYNERPIDEEVKRITAGKGVQVAYDSVGAATYMQCLKSLAPLGYLVLYGNSSGAVPAIDPLLLSQSGSLFLTRPTLLHYVQTVDSFQHRASEVFSWILLGKLKLSVSHTFPLSAAAEAHKQLEARKTTGKIILIP